MDLGREFSIGGDERLIGSERNLLECSGPWQNCGGAVVQRQQIQRVNVMAAIAADRSMSN